MIRRQEKFSDPLDEQEPQRLTGSRSPTPRGVSPSVEV